MAVGYSFDRDSAERIVDVVKQVEASPLFAGGASQSSDDIQDALEECGPFYPIVKHIGGAHDAFWIGEGTRPAFRRTLPPAYVRLKDLSIYETPSFGAPEEIDVVTADIEGELGEVDTNGEWPYMLALIVDTAADSHQYAILRYYDGVEEAKSWTERIYDEYDTGDKHLFPLGYTTITKPGDFYKIKDIQYPNASFLSGGGGGSSVIPDFTVKGFTGNTGNIQSGSILLGAINESFTDPTVDLTAFATGDGDEADIYIKIESTGVTFIGYDPTGIPDQPTDTHDALHILLAHGTYSQPNPPDPGTWSSIQVRTGSISDSGRMFEPEII